jgi:hypothetical protein
MRLVDLNVLYILSFSTLNATGALNSAVFLCIKWHKMQNIQIIYTTALHFQGEEKKETANKTRQRTHWNEVFNQQIQWAVRVASAPEKPVSVTSLPLVSKSYNCSTRLLFWHNIKYCWCGWRPSWQREKRQLRQVSLGRLSLMDWEPVGSDGCCSHCVA